MPISKFHLQSVVDVTGHCLVTALQEVYFSAWAVCNTVLISAKKSQHRNKWTRALVHVNYNISVRLKIHSNTISKPANMHWIGLKVQMVIINNQSNQKHTYCNTVHMTKVTWNFNVQGTPLENAKLKYSKIFTLQNRQIKMQLKHSVFLQLSVWRTLLCTY